MTNAALWSFVNRRLVASSLGELSYEQILKPVRSGNDPSGDESSPGPYRLILSTGLIYEFSAWRSVWDFLRVQADSVQRIPALGEGNQNLAAQFFIDIQKEIQIDDIVLANFLEEMHNSLYSEMVIAQKQQAHPVAEMIHWSGEKVQTLLSGHPKLVLNKGRMGWGADDLQRYAPENEQPVQLHWLALRKSLCALNIEKPEDILRESFRADEFAKFQKVLQVEKIDLAQFAIVPVHPWQWQRFIQIQFAGEIAQGHIVSLGCFGDDYLPQISLRTLSNISRPEKMDIKLPITVLNTSAFRGIAAKYIPIGEKLSRAMEKLCREDRVLAQAQTGVLSETAGASFRQSDFAQVALAPYRYHEYLGAIWRQSSQSKLGADEQAWIAGSLFYQDAEGKSLLGALIKAAQIPTAQWLKLYFEVVVVPLYHLQIKYGLGLVAHGQNIVLRLKNHQPAGILLKDFQGDLRLSVKPSPWVQENLGGLAQELTRLPPEYLIHDLLTGHFVTVLRFISAALRESENFPEGEFYGILVEVLQGYLRENKVPVPPALDLFAPEIARVVVNKVRFKIGYADTAERPLPLLAANLINPLYVGWQQREVSRD